MFLVMTELIILWCNSRRNSSEIFLLLDGKGKMDMAEDILPYLSAHSLFCGRVLLHIDNETDVDRFIVLEDALYPKIRLYPFLYRGDNAAEYLVKNYPQKAIYRY